MDRNHHKLSINVEHAEEDTKTGDLPFYRRPLSPSHELLVWEKWIQIRKEETEKLAKILNRPPVDLAMNLSEMVREDIERKTALEQAQIKKKPAVRGTLFERPPRLKQKCYCSPVYEAQRTPAQLGLPRVIEHISVPNDIQETELGMAGESKRKTCHQLNADYINYRRKREEQLKVNLRKVDPFKPASSKLIIQGHKPKTPPPKAPTPPTISIDGPTFNAEDSISGIHALRINKTVLYKDIPGQPLLHLPTIKKQSWHEDCTSWSYYFNVPVKRMGRGKVFLQNLGTITLMYCWKKIKRPLPFIPGDIYEQVFFFNKNEDVLSPGQCKDICISFVSDKPGIYSEFWELTFSNVCFFDTVNEKLVINLYADSVENAEDMKRRVEILKTRIHRKSIDNLINEYINEIFDTIFADVPQTYPYKKYFLEAQLFVMKNPVCFYHQTEVAKLNELYNEMAPGETWDLSISAWRQVMMSKQYDDRMKYFDALKKSHHECLKPWYEGEELLKEKYRAVNDLWGQLADKLDKEYDRLTDLYMLKSVDIPISLSKSQINTMTIDPLTEQWIRNIFFLHAYDHVATFIEQCAGTLTSLDSNRWINFDFCRT